MGVTEEPATPSVDVFLNGVIDSYFGATSDPSAVVAGGDEVRKKMLQGALGGEYSKPSETTQVPRGRSGARGDVASSTPSGGTGDGSTSSYQPLKRELVYPTLARLIMGN